MHLLKHSANTLEDRLYRSLGTLSFARIMATDEAARCLSDVRLGIDLGLIEDVDVSILNECMVFMQPGFLQKYAGTTLNTSERDMFRAKLLGKDCRKEEKQNNKRRGICMMFNRFTQRCSKGITTCSRRSYSFET